MDTPGTLDLTPEEKNLVEQFAVALAQGNATKFGAASVDGEGIWSLAEEIVRARPEYLK